MGEIKGRVEKVKTSEKCVQCVGECGHNIRKMSSMYFLRSSAFRCCVWRKLLIVTLFGRLVTSSAMTINHFDVLT